MESRGQGGRVRCGCLWGAESLGRCPRCPWGGRCCREPGWEEGGQHLALWLPKARGAHLTPRGVDDGHQGADQAGGRGRVFAGV